MPHVLVVDDYPEICPLLQQALQALPGCRVSAASTGGEGLTLLHRQRPDVVIVDALMPGISGIEVADEASHLGVPVLLMTGDAATSEVLTETGWRHVHKPFRIDALLDEVRAVLAESRSNLAMVCASLERLLEAREAHDRVYSRLRESQQRLQASLIRSRAFREGRRPDEPST